MTHEIGRGATVHLLYELTPEEAQRGAEVALTMAVSCYADWQAADDDFLTANRRYIGAVPPFSERVTDEDIKLSYDDMQVKYKLFQDKLGMAAGLIGEVAATNQFNDLLQQTIDQLPATDNLVTLK